MRLAALPLAPGRGRCRAPSMPPERHLRRLARAPIGMAQGFCAGIVVAPPADFERAHHPCRRACCCRCRAARISWSPTWANGTARGGKVFRITAERGKPTVITPVLTDLYMPHAMALRPRRQGLCQRTGPHLPLRSHGRRSQSDGRNRDRRRAGHAGRASISIPLSSFIFDANNDMLVSVGAPSDQCLVGPPSSKDGKPDGDNILRPVGRRLQGRRHPALCLSGRRQMVAQLHHDGAGPAQFRGHGAAQFRHLAAGGERRWIFRPPTRHSRN